MLPRPRVLPLLAVLVLAASPRAAAADERVFVRPWAELEPFVLAEGEFPVPSGQAAARLLDEARTLVSAMVYGWSFDWTPADRTRGVADRFELVPLAEIPRGSDRLAIRDSGISDRRMWAQAEYRMTPSELLRRSSWAGATVDGSTGTGEASVFTGRAGKMTALANAVKEAIRLDLHDRVLNRPRTIRGEAVLWEDPEFGLWSGAYHAVARVKLRVTEVIPYSLF